VSIHSEIITALADVASGRVFPDYAKEKTPYPLVVFRRVKYAPIMTLIGPEGTANSEFVFECWGKDTPSETAKAAALALAGELRDAINASDIVNKYEVEVGGDDFDAETLELMEPVQFSFWHDT
jgi:hypothetical protein